MKLKLLTWHHMHWNGDKCTMTEDRIWRDVEIDLCDFLEIEEYVKEDWTMCRICTKQFPFPVHMTPMAREEILSQLDPTERSIVELAEARYWEEREQRKLTVQAAKDLEDKKPTREERKKDADAGFTLQRIVAPTVAETLRHLAEM